MAGEAKRQSEAVATAVEAVRAAELAVRHQAVEKAVAAEAAKQAELVRIAVERAKAAKVPPQPAANTDIVSSLLLSGRDYGISLHVSKVLAFTRNVYELFCYSTKKSIHNNFVVFIFHQVQLEEVLNFLGSAPCLKNLFAATLDNTLLKQFFMVRYNTIVLISKNSIELVVTHGNLCRVMLV